MHCYGTGTETIEETRSLLFYSKNYRCARLLGPSLKLAFPDERSTSMHDHQLKSVWLFTCDDLSRPLHIVISEKNIASEPDYVTHSHGEGVS